MWCGPAACNRVRGRRCLRYALAIAAGHRLAHVLDDLPAPRFALERLRDDLSQFAQARTAALVANARCGMNDALARQMVGQKAGAPVWGLSGILCVWGHSE